MTLKIFKMKNHFNVKGKNHGIKLVDIFVVVISSITMILSTSSNKNDLQCLSTLTKCGGN